jgi:hypothetical protein
VALVVAGCKGKEDLPHVPPLEVHPAGIASARAIDAAAVELAFDPPAPAGDLKTDIENFTSISACVQLRTQLDPLVADALESIGYETFLVDACRTLDALKARDTKRCLPIDSSFLRQRCEREVAMLAPNVDLCPFEIPTRHEYGRDPLCIAVASRTPSLCAGVTIIDRARCEALATGAGEPCARVPFAGPRSRCEREASRWRTILDGPRKTLILAPPKGKLRVSAEGGSTGAGPPETDLSQLLYRGVVVRESAGDTRVTIGTFRESGATTFAPSPTTNTTFTADLVIGHKSTELRRAELAIPNSVTLAIPGAPSSLRTLVTKLERTRGGEVHITIEGEIGATPKKFRVRADIATFVRDVVQD